MVDGGSDGGEARTKDDGPDTLSGGSGVDAVDYSTRTTGVTVTLGGGPANDGEAGEDDSVGADVEGVLGGAGDDILIGDDLANAL